MNTPSLVTPAEREALMEPIQEEKMKPTDIVKYAKPEAGEEDLRFVLLELHAAAIPPRAHIQLICDDEIKPVETVSPEDICAC